MRKQYRGFALAACISGFIGLSTTAFAGDDYSDHETTFQFDVTVQGVDAIFIAGRTDVLPIPTPNGNPDAFILKRHNFLVPEFPLTEELPPSIPVTEGSIVSLVSSATGGVSFFNGFSGAPTPITSPEGNPNSESILSSLGGISGYKGPEGALVGVFLNDSIPSTEPAPDTLDFTSAGLGTSFHKLSPSLGQVFFIGDGFFHDNAKHGHGSDKQNSRLFVAPLGATRLVLGIPDGFGFDGVPGAYEDNNGAYTTHLRVTIPH